MARSGTPQGQMRHRTMAEYALEQLRESIILGELPAGTPLRLDELARSLGMSISPIREAVRQLEALGLAKHVPHQGARVLDFDIEELRDLFQVRLALESLAVRRAAERFKDADAAAARAHLDRFDAAARSRRRARDDARAHRLPLHAVRGVAVAVARRADPAARGTARSGSARRCSPRRRRAQERHREFDERAARRVRRARRRRRPRAALHDHLELASVIFEHELGGRGIFDGLTVDALAP